MHKIENSLQIIVHVFDRTMLEKSRKILQSSTKTQTRYYNDVYQSPVTHADTKLEELVEFSSNLQSIKFNQAQYYVTRKEKWLSLINKFAPVTTEYVLSQLPQIV